MWHLRARYDLSFTTARSAFLKLGRLKPIYIDYGSSKMSPPTTHLQTENPQRRVQLQRSLPAGHAISPRCPLHRLAPNRYPYSVSRPCSSFPACRSLLGSIEENFRNKFLESSICTLINVPKLSIFISCPWEKKRYQLLSSLAYFLTYNSIYWVSTAEWHSPSAL